MAQCEIVNPIKVNIHNVSHLRLKDERHLEHNYFTYLRSLSYFSQGIWKRPPSGLINIGYNCYMNVVIQCLAYTPGFQQFCLTMPNVMYECNQEGAFFLDSLAHIFALLNERRSICPDWLISDSHFINNSYGLPVQQDAHEFLLSLLDEFDKECKKALDNNNSSSSDNSDTMISNMFGGKIDTCIVCESCEHVVSNSTCFRDLSVPLNTYEDVEAAVNEMMSSSRLKLEGKCENCGEQEGLYISKKMIRYPLILILTLMRFDNNCKKIEDFFKFQKFLEIGENHDVKYQLYSMIVHEGRLINRGHYVSYVMDYKEDWYKADDVCIYKVDEEKVMSTCPYVLFYKRINVDT